MKTRDMGMMSHISFIACRISGIDFQVLLGMCVLLCEHNIACVLRWGVTLVRVYSTGICSPHRRTPFSVVQVADPLSGCAGSRPSSGTASMKETGCGFGYILYFILSTLMTCI